MPALLVVRWAARQAALALVPPLLRAALGPRVADHDALRQHLPRGRKRSPSTTCLDDELDSLHGTKGEVVDLSGDSTGLRARSAASRDADSTARPNVDVTSLRLPAAGDEGEDEDAESDSGDPDQESHQLVAERLASTYDIGTPVRFFTYAATTAFAAGPMVSMVAWMGM